MKNKLRKNKKNGVKKTKKEFLCKNVNWATETATYFGFSSATFPEITKEDKEQAIAVEKEERETAIGSLPFLELPERIAILRNYIEKKQDKEPQPILTSFSMKKNEGKIFRFGLEAIGATKSIADATVIKTAYEILKEKGYQNLSVAINSMGDKESFNRFIKEFTIYCKKNLENMQASCRQEFKKNPIHVLSCKNEKCKKILEEAPKPLNSLSESSRLHFKEVLEHIEVLNIPYQISDNLVADNTFGCQTIFTIQDSSEKNKTLASGARYNVLSKKIGFKKELPAIGARIEIKELEGKIVASRKVEKPLVAFVQIGCEAKLKSLQIVEMLRETKIPTYQSLSRDKLSSQLQIAENLKIPFTIIMGQKEAMENSVIVRSMTNRSQETIKLENLSKYLERLLKQIL